MSAWGMKAVKEAKVMSTELLRHFPKNILKNRSKSKYGTIKKNNFPFLNSRCKTTSYEAHVVHNLAPRLQWTSCDSWGGGGRFKNTYELLNLRALKISHLYKNCIFQCMGKIFCVEFQRYPLKFHTQYLTHTLEDADFIHWWKFKSS